MNKLRAYLSFSVVGLLLSGAVSAQSFTSRNDQAKADALLKQMTTEEKIGQLNQPFYTKLPIPGAKNDPVSFEDHVRCGEVGSFLFVTDPKEINRLQKIAMNEQRLHIPILFGFDVIHGFDTEFPVPLAMAASWDPAIAEQAQAIAAEEAAHAGVRWSFAPMLDIARDPRWGRISEGAGEDPYLGAAMARAQVRGFQGTPENPRLFLATLKHFAGYGAAEGGRDYDAVYIPEERLQNVYLPPFRAGVEAGAATVMSAYMDLNDVPAAGNVHLLQDILRKEFDFKGFVVSDAFAVGSLVTQGFAKDGEDAAFRGATAGVDMDMGSATYLEHMKSLLSKAQITTPQLDDMVRPILAAKYHLGLFEHPYVSGEGLFAVIRRRYSRWFLFTVLIGVLIGNVIEAGADIGGMAAALNILIPLPIGLIVVITGLTILAFQIWGSYTLLRNVFRVLALALLAYIGSAVLAHPDVRATLRGSFIPTIRFNKDFLAMIVAVIGTSLSAYLYTWQSNEKSRRRSQLEKEGYGNEEERAGPN